MRRWLAILFLTLLPLQSSWAAVAAYCGHEAEQHAQHLGHHEHQHAAQPAVSPDSAPADPSEASGFDCDCSHCHGCCASLPAPAGDLVQPTRASRPATQVEGFIRTRAQSPPERPQWLPLA